MAKRRTKRAEQRAKRNATKDIQMQRPSGNSRYGRKHRNEERARGYSTRPTSPFYLPESQRGD